MSKQIVAWDLGATKCAAALTEYNEENQSLHCKKRGLVKIRACQSLEELSHQLEGLLETKMSEVDAICIGAAGQYDGETLQLDKGYPYPMHFSSLSQLKHWPPFTVIHDYSPIVCATFTDYLKNEQNIIRLNKAEMNPFGRRVALGVGTGIGMKDGILLADGNFWLGTNEIGHLGVINPPLCDPYRLKRHQEFLAFLYRENIISNETPLTFEKILANTGIVLIHRFFDPQATNKSVEEVGELVRTNKANETLALFSWYLGLLVGTIQLGFMPDGGIWLTGGVVLSHLEIFDHEDFYLGIEASPAYLNLRKEFPLGVLTGTDHAFMGGAYYALKRLF